MKALSIRQPWAWAILNAGKNIENRGWPTRFRGRFLVHASQGMTKEEYEDFVDTYVAVRQRWPQTPREIPAMQALRRGGIIGSVELVHCVSQSASPWFFGLYGFVLANPEPLPFRRLKGRLGFFETEMPEASDA